MPDEPTLNDEFPIGDALSPPYLHKPVYECAEVVHLSGFIPHAIVRVYAGGGELLAEERPLFGFADVPLRRRVGQGEALTATTEVNGRESGPSAPPVIVEPLPESAIKNTKPVVGGGAVGVRARGAGVRPGAEHPSACAGERYGGRGRPDRHRGRPGGDEPTACKRAGRRAADRL
jgi:hypothetical protein